MELLPHVQEKLLPGHKSNTVIEAGLVEDFKKTTRVVALIEFTDLGGGGLVQALFVYQTVRVPVHSSYDLNLELAIPVDNNFKWEIDTSSVDTGSEVLVQLTSGKTRLLFEMPFGQQTNAFVSDVMRAAEVLGRRRGVAPEFSWLKSYFPPSGGAKEDLIVAKGVPNKAGNGLEFDAIPEENSNPSDAVTEGRKSASNAPARNYVLDSQDASGEGTPTSDMGVNRQNIAMGVSPTPISARESHIKHFMSLRETEYTNDHQYTVFAGTWNVNGQYPSVGLAGWLASDDAPPDIYAVAFQELDLNKEAFLFNVTAREQEWLSAVLNGVHPKAKYAKVSLVRLVGMMLVVLVQERHLAYVRGVCTDTVGTGILNKWGNKGGVGVRLDLHGTSLCFVNAHMAAHVEEFERRNEDHDCIFLRTAFPVRLRGPPAAIRDHDHVYFLGDMNYRLNLTNGAEIRRAADRGDYESLLKHDQLIDQQLKKRVFHDFNEGKITFKPTYKYDLLSDDWDSSEKARKPAWCDRILYRGEGIALRQYRSHPAVNISDHKPVSAVFDASIKVIDTTRYRRVYEDVMKQLDKLENEFLPQVTVDTTEILLGPVRFMQPQTQSLTIANTGQVPINFEFINKLNEDRICKPWLSVRPCAGFIMPGQKCDVALEVVVRKQMAFLLNRGVEKLYDIVVLHLAGGKDIFITVAGDYERSCFGSSLNALVHMNRPLKDTPVSELLDLESEHPKHQRDLPYAVPKELWYLVDHIMSYGLHIEGLFTMPGLQKDLMDIRTALDAGVPGDGLPGHIHSVAEALLVFLDALPEPVVPYRLYERALEATPNFSLCKEVVQDLPDHHRTTFNYLMTFLKELLLNTTDKALDAKTLAQMFGSVLLRSPDAMCAAPRRVDRATERKMHTFVHHFLVNDYD